MQRDYSKSDHYNKMPKTDNNSKKAAEAEAFEYFDELNKISEEIEKCRRAHLK